MAVQTRLREPGLRAFSGRREASSLAASGTVLLFACAFVLLVALGPSLLGDTDTLWHIETGARIWREGRFPWTDPFSHTFGGQPWMAKEWLSQIILFAAKSLAGWSGVVVVTAATVALLLALIHAWLAERCRSTFALMLSLVAGALLAPHCLARPHIFALLPLFVWTASLVRAADEGRSPSAWPLVALVFWANLHASFPLAYPIAAILGLEAILNAPKERRKETILHWAAFGALALGAGCVTPYGIHVLLLPFQFVGTNEGIPLIVEWQPLDWSPLGIVARGSAVLMLVGLAAGGWRNALRVLLVGFVGVMMVRYSRFLDVFAVVAPLAVAVPFARRFRELAPERGGGAQPLVIPVAAAGLAVAALAILIAWPPEPKPGVVPRAALAAARAAGVSGPVYNSYDLGGFMIAEGIPTFIDGRPDQLFRGGFFHRLNDLTEGDDPSAFVEFIEKYGVTWAIVDGRASERRLLDEAPGWRRIHRDAYASVYVKELRGTLN